MMWKNVENWNAYAVSDTGVVKSNEREINTGRNCKVKKKLKEKIMKQNIQPNGYCCVWFRQPGVRKKQYIHRLVAKTFIDNPDHLPAVNHKDLNKKNNHHSNLEWVSQDDNMKHYHHYRKKCIEENLKF